MSWAWCVPLIQCYYFGYFNFGHKNFIHILFVIKSTSLYFLIWCMCNRVIVEIKTKGVVCVLPAVVKIRCGCFNSCYTSRCLIIYRFTSVPYLFAYRCFFTLYFMCAFGVCTPIMKV